MSKRKINQPPPGQSKPALTKLKELPSADRAKLMEVLRANTYAQAVPLVENLFGFACSADVLFRFFRWQSTQESLENANDLVATFEEFARKQNPDWSPDKVRETAISFFLAHTAQTKDVDSFVSVAHLDLSERSAKTKAGFEREKIDIQKRKVALLEKKAAQADQAKGILENKELTEEQKRNRMREVFGIS
jgi:hypothetical protein